MNEQQLQLQIVLLVQAAMQGDQQATQQIQRIVQAAQQGDQQAAQLALMIQAVAQQMQLQQVQAAKFGAKLNYIRQLRGLCPEGQELEYYRDGGRLCKKCVQKHKMQDGGEVPSNPVDAFKCGRKMKKKACGGLMKKGSVEKNESGTSKGGITLKSEKKSKNKLGDTVTTRRWLDGTTSKRYTPEEGETIYEGRKGERGIEQQDSLWRADWSKKIAPQTKKK